MLSSVVFLMMPFGAVADVPEPTPDSSLNRLIITEVQTGNATRADEFIELYNTTDQPLDLSGWQLRYITASDSSIKSVVDPSSTIVLAPPVVDGATSLLPGHEHYLLYAGVVSPPAGAIARQYDALLPATGGSLVLVSPDNTACEWAVEDAIAWGSTNHLFGEAEALVPGASSSKDKIFQRYIDAVGSYVNTGNNSQDFWTGEATALPYQGTPAAASSQFLPSSAPLGSGVASQIYAARFDNVDCALPDPSTDPPDNSPPSTTPPADDPGMGGETEQDAPDPPSIPSANAGLTNPQVSELLPNPAQPQTDADDEFVEFYNPNDAVFDLSDYTIEAGTITKHRFVIPTGTTLLPKSFVAFFSADTGLSLSNSVGQVRLIDPLGAILAESDEYSNARDGESWILAEGKWQWTVSPTPNSLNMVNPPLVKSVATASTAKKSTKKSAPKSKVASASSKKSSTKTKTQDDTAQLASAVTESSRDPLHPGVLAAIAASALLYGAYEYRQDVANKIYQFRSNRAARRALRQSVKGR
jgi:hypothetical protein